MRHPGAGAAKALDLRHRPRHSAAPWAPSASAPAA